MLENLIKLSKELLEMELTKESLEIDSLIHKLYGISGTAPDLSDSFDETYYYEEDRSFENSSSDDLKRVISSSSSEEFRENISEVLIESLSVHELELIKEALTDYLD